MGLFKVPIKSIAGIVSGTRCVPVDPLGIMANSKGTSTIEDSDPHPLLNLPSAHSRPYFGLYHGTRVIRRWDRILWYSGWYKKCFVGPKMACGNSRM